jgi:hypothetical protein
MKFETKLGLRGHVAGVLDYLSRRFPLKSLGVALAVTFLCAYLVYGSAAGHQEFGIGTILGAASFVLLFLQLRIIDDLDDVESSKSPEESGGQIRQRKLQLVAGLLATTLLLVAMNWNSQALPAALAATALMIVNPFILKDGVKKYITKPSDPDQLTTGSVIMDLLLAIPYEGVPALLVLYIFYAWTAVTQKTLPSGVIIAVTATFWALYEIWKYSRLLARPDWRPYGLGWKAGKILLMSLLLVAAILQLVTARLSGLSPIYSAYALILTGVFVILIWRMTPPAVKGNNAKLRALSGLAYVGATDLGILVASLASS